MKNLLSIILFSLLIFCSCEDDMQHKINGQWQLKTIEYNNGTTEKVDTIFYAFQKEAVFSFTLLENPNSTAISYGYLDFPSDNEIMITIDQNQMFPNFLEISRWESYEQIFQVDNVSSDQLVISDKEKKYIFNKH